MEESEWSIGSCYLHKGQDRIHAPNGLRHVLRLWEEHMNTLGVLFLAKSGTMFSSILYWIWKITFDNVRTVSFTHIQAKNAISKEFWNRMMWIRLRMSRGLLNQKWLSEGWTTNSPSTTICLSATSWANCVIICSNLVPTASKSCQKENHCQMLNTFSNLQGLL